LSEIYLVNKIPRLQGSNIAVTIGICVKNGEATLGAAIESIMTQDYPHDKLEIVIVDDGSTDNTFSVIQSFLPKLDIPIKVFRQQWSGLGVSRNVVVNQSSGEFIIWVDSDMTLTRTFVTQQAAFMERNNVVGIAKGQYGICNQRSISGYLENIEFVAAHLRRREKPNSLPLGTGGSIYRVNAIKQVGGFDYNIKGSGEDADAEHRVRKAGWRLETTGAVFFEHRRGSWRSLWKEYFWFGKSGSRLLENDRQFVEVYRLWPPIISIVEVERAIKAYQLTGCSVVFLLPIHYIFKRAAWFLGYLRIRFFN
jgi:glycosyltransferase involved in cell wall biosynthesis